MPFFVGLVFVESFTASRWSPHAVLYPFSIVVCCVGGLRLVASTQLQLTTECATDRPTDRPSDPRDEIVCGRVVSRLRLQSRAVHVRAHALHVRADARSTMYIGRRWQASRLPVSPSRRVPRCSARRALVRVERIVVATALLSSIAALIFGRNTSCVPTSPQGRHGQCPQVTSLAGCVLAVWHLSGANSHHERGKVRRRHSMRRAHTTIHEKGHPQR